MTREAVDAFRIARGQTVVSNEYRKHGKRGNHIHNWKGCSKSFCFVTVLYFIIQLGRQSKKAKKQFFIFVL